MTAEQIAERKLDETVARAAGLDVHSEWHRCWWDPEGGGLQVEGETEMGDTFGTEPHPVYVPDWGGTEDRDTPYNWEPVPFYSTQISTAFELLDMLRKRFTNVSLHAANGWGLTCWNIDPEGKSKGVVGPFSAATAPMAICLTFLAAHELE